MWILGLILLLIGLTIFNQTASKFLAAGKEGDIAGILQYGIVLIIITIIVFS